MRANRRKKPSPGAPPIAEQALPGAMMLPIVGVMIMTDFEEALKAHNEM